MLSPIGLDFCLIHIKIRLAQLAGNDDGPGADPSGHIEKLAHQLRDDIRPGKHLTCAATVRFKRPGDDLGA